MNIQKSPSGRVWRLPRNIAGRDFVVGDIHGAYDSLKSALKTVGFKVGADRLFSVGDLIDRGNDSARVAPFLSMPGVFAIQGNHEDMYLELFSGPEMLPASVRSFTDRNGMGWVWSLDNATRLEIAAKLRALPLVIEVETERGTVGLVHGDVPKGMSWATFIERIENNDKDTVQTALWGRDRIQAGDNHGVEGIGRMFVGHTIQWKGLKRLGNVYAIDTGAIFGEQSERKESQIRTELGDGHLTLALMTMTTGPLTVPKMDGGTDIRHEDADNKAPFGAYARPRS